LEDSLPKNHTYGQQLVNPKPILNGGILISYANLNLGMEEMNAGILASITRAEGICC